MLRCELWFNKGPQGIEIEVYYLQVPEEVHSIPPGATLEGQGRLQTEKGRTHTSYFLLRFVGRGIWGF